MWSDLTSIREQYQSCKLMGHRRLLARLFGMFRNMDKATKYLKQMEIHTPVSGGEDFEMDSNGGLDANIPLESLDSVSCARLLLHIVLDEGSKGHFGYMTLWHTSPYPYCGESLILHRIGDNLWQVYYNASRHGD